MQNNNQSQSKTRPIEYVTVGLSVVSALGTVYLILADTGVFKKTKKEVAEDKE